MTIAHVYRKSRFFSQKTNKRGLSPWRDMRICWPLGIFYSILIMRWNTITSSSTPSFAHCLGHQGKISSHLLLFIFQLLEVRELFCGIWRSIGHEFHKTFQKIRTISIQKKDYLCSLLWNCEANCEAPFAVCFETTKQTAKHPLQFQSKLRSTLCSFKPSFVVFIKVQRSFVVWIETAKCAS